MALSKKPVTGMKDILPEEMKIRNYVQNVIKETYNAFGFTQIETPCVEHITNRRSKQGGENEKLIFKILKRGEKLNLETATEEMDVVDNGLRYDLTVPLVRYYSKNANDLPSPFKALQMGNVWRADRPQRGRYRQFMQCDIDILGDPSNLAEIELILATTTTLGKLGFKNFQIRINERRILKAMASYSGFPEESFDSVFIILDKMDKIGLEGVKEELIKYDFAPESVEKYIQLFENIENQADPIGYLADKLGDFMGDDVKQWMDEIIDSVKATKSSDFEIVFDPTLVRGMSYYTGTIFEIAIPEFGGSCGRLVAIRTCSYLSFQIQFVTFVHILIHNLRQTVGCNDIMPLCSFGNLGSISQRISTIRCSQRESCYCRTCIEVFYPRILSYVSYQYHSIY